MEAQSDPEGFVPVDRISLLKDDMTADEVRSLLGPPASTLPPSEVIGPSESFHAFGSSFSFAADRDLDEVWVYRHRRRGKLTLKNKITTYLGFRAGILQGAWKVNSPGEPPD